MKKYNIVNILKNMLYIWVALNILFIYGSWNGIIRYGFGLADILYDILIALISIVSLIFFKKHVYPLKIDDQIPKSVIIFYVFCLLFFILTILMTTILRGPESRWDGKIFY